MIMVLNSVLVYHLKRKIAKLLFSLDLFPKSLYFLKIQYKELFFIYYINKLSIRTPKYEYMYLNKKSKQFSSFPIPH